MVAIRDLRNELLGNDPVVWSNNVGDVLVGTVLRYIQRTIGGTLRYVCVVQPDNPGDPLILVPLASTSIIAEFKRDRPEGQERIALTRLPNQAGQPVYKLWMPRSSDDVVVPWDSL